jgi:hypothetical protein
MICKFGEAHWINIDRIASFGISDSLNAEAKGTTIYIDGSPEITVDLTPAQVAERIRDCRRGLTDFEINSL